MKKSEFRKLIREEISKVLAEGEETNDTDTTETPSAVLVS